MNLWRKLRCTGRALFQKSQLDADMAEEMRSHLELRTQENVEAGMNPEEARYAALRQFGRTESIQETCRDQRGVWWLENLGRDIRYGARQLCRNPGFTAVVVLTLALGIGAVIAIFTVADDLLFRPLPYREPDRLVRLWESNPMRQETAHNLVSTDNFLDWKERNSVFEDMAAYYEGRSVLYGGDRAEEVHIQGVTDNFFSLLGVQAVQGRLFAPAEDADTDPGLVISDRLWRSRFGADPGVIGRPIRLDSISGLVRGVTPPGFSFGDREVDVWLSLELRRSVPKGQGRDLNAIARLRPGVRAGQAQAQMGAIATSLEQQDPELNRNWTVQLEPLRDSFTGNEKKSLQVLLVAVSLLLAISCGNAANLLLARLFSRRAELGIRAALGAGRWRLLQQLLTESLLLAVGAGAAGLALGRLLLTGLVSLAPQALTQAADLAVDSRVVIFAVAVATVTGVMFGVLPALISARTEVAPELKTSARSATSPARALRSWLIAGEIAASVILLTGGSLLFRSLAKLQAVDSGLHAGQVLTFHFRVASPDNVKLFALAIDRMASLPGIRSASATSFLPFDGPPATTRVSIDGRPAAQPGEELVATVRTIMPRYFESVGIPLRLGRDFTPADNDREGPMRFIVNEAFARKYLAHQEALEARISTTMARTAPFGQIIGVVGDVKEGSLRQEAVPTVYYPYGHLTYGQMNLVVRTDGDPMALLAPVRDIIHSLDPSIPVADARTMAGILGETYARERFGALLMNGFSAISLLIAAVGLYGILSYSVSERTREIGIRLTVGAQGWDIVKMVLKDAGRLVVPGLIAGMAGAWGIGRFISSLLFETGSSDAVSSLLAPAVLVLVALLAAYLPARRALAVDPMIALRVQ